MEENMKSKKLIFICGLCVIESEKMTLEVAKYLKDLTDKYNVDFYFKASFDKANRTSIDSFRGLGEKKGLEILKKVKKEVGCKILTDVHNSHQAIVAGEIVDVVQIPAFLCRQTDLVVAVGKTDKIINIKKGQFLAPTDMKYIVDKLTKNNINYLPDVSKRDNKIFLTERGSCFGYNNLIVDFRNFTILKNLGYPVIFDVTHSLQSGKINGQTGGNSELAISMARAGVATGAISGIFAEVHPNPQKAKSDSATSLSLNQTKYLLEECLKIWKDINE